MVNDMAALLQQQQQAGAALPAASVALGAGASGAVAAAAAAKPALAAVAGPVSAHVVPLDQSKLNARQTLRLEFARRITNAIVDATNESAGTGAMPTPQLLPAVSIPSAADEPKRCFRDCLYFDAAASGGRLYVRAEALEAAGDLTLILAHALAVIKASPYDLTADATPAVMTQLHRNLATIASEMFKQHAQGGSAGTSASPVVHHAASSSGSGGMLAIGLSGGRAAPTTPRGLASPSKRFGDFSSIAGAVTSMSTPTTPRLGEGAGGESLTQRIKKYQSALRMISSTTAASQAAAALPGAGMMTGR
jgi:hypothetical protein